MPGASKICLEPWNSLGHWRKGPSAKSVYIQGDKLLDSYKKDLFTPGRQVEPRECQKIDGTGTKWPESTEG